MFNNFVIVDRNGIIKNFSPELLVYNFKINDSVDYYFSSEDGKFINFIVNEVISTRNSYRVRLFINNQIKVFCQVTPTYSDDLALIILEQLPNDKILTNQNHYELKKRLELINELSLDFLKLDDNINPYVFLGEKLRMLLPDCTIVINKYQQHNDLFITEYIETPIESIKSFIDSLKSNIQQISFSLPSNQKILATSGRLVELEKEEFLSAQYFFNKELLTDFISKIPIHKIYIIGFVTNSYLLGNITLITHKPEIQVDIIEPIVNHASLLIQKHIAQERIIENHKFYHSLLNTTQEFICVVDHTNTILFANKACQEFLNKININCNILNEDVSIVFSFLNHKFIEKLETVKKHCQPAILETSSTIDNTTYYFNITITPDVKKSRKQYIVTVKDITNWIFSKKQVDSLTEVNKIIIDNLNEGLLLINENYQIVHCNNKFLELFSFEKENIISKSIFDLMPIDFKEKAENALKSMFKEGKSFTKEFIIQKEGKDINLKEEIHPVIENNSVKFLISIIRDCTEEKQKELELLNSKKQAEKKEQLKSTLIATISHEIRTPLNAINGFANLLLKTDLTESKKKQYISHIYKSSYALSRLIDDLIDITNIEVGRFSIQKETVFVYPLLEQLYEQFTHELQIRQKYNVKLILTNTPEDNIPFITDELRLKQVLSNLISNSIKYTYQGEIKFGFSLMNNCIIFFVKDTGIGIKKEQIEKLFQPFQKYENSYTDTDKSLGLGLYIVKSIVEQLNGTLHIESELNIGSTFSIRFSYSMITSSASTSPHFKKDIISLNLDKELNILIAEDDDINFMFLEEMLSHEKIRIIRAKNGQEAIELFKQHQCNLHIILMDIQMPIIDGITATKIIKEISSNIPIIAQTAYAYTTEKEESLKVGCSDYIVKPIDQNELLSKISYYANLNSL